MDPRLLAAATQVATRIAAKHLMVPVEAVKVTVAMRPKIGRPRKIVTDDAIRAAVAAGGTRADQAARVGLSRRVFFDRLSQLSVEAGEKNPRVRKRR